MKLKKVTGTFAILGLLSFGTLPALAEVDNPETWIEYRGLLMDSMKAHNKAAKRALKLGPDHLLAHARSLQESASLIVASFPEGSDFGETEAKADVWDDPDGFAAAGRKYADAVDRLVQAAGAGDMNAAGEALKAVGKGCKGCHDDYREKN